MGLQSRTKWIRRQPAAGQLIDGVVPTGDGFFTIKGLKHGGATLNDPRRGQLRVMSARDAAKHLAGAR